MSGFFLVNQAPTTFNFVLNDGATPTGFGLYFTGVGTNQIGHLAPNNNSKGGVYISPYGLSPNIFINQKGTMSISCVKTGATTGTLTVTPFNDSASAIGGVTTYTLTCTDSANGIPFTQINSIVWSAL
jgi:hypothetical protein